MRRHCHGATRLDTDENNDIKQRTVQLCPVRSYKRRRSVRNSLNVSCVTLTLTCAASTEKVEQLGLDLQKHARPF